MEKIEKIKKPYKVVGNTLGIVIPVMIHKLMGLTDKTNVLISYDPNIETLTIRKVEVPKETTGGK